MARLDGLGAVFKLGKIEPAQDDLLESHIMDMRTGATFCINDGRYETRSCAEFAIQVMVWLYGTALHRLMGTFLYPREEPIGLAETDESGGCWTSQ
jgi:hypothetical protein